MSSPVRSKFLLISTIILGLLISGCAGKSDENQLLANACERLTIFSEGLDMSISNEDYRDEDYLYRLNTMLVAFSELSIKFPKYETLNGSINKINNASEDSRYNKENFTEFKDLCDSQTTTTSNPSDFLGRLNASGADEWTQDAFKPFNPIVGFETDYISGASSSPEGCNISIYDSRSNAENAMNNNLAFNLGSMWAGEDYLTHKGIILTSHGEFDACVSIVFKVFNWA